MGGVGAVGGYIVSPDAVEGITEHTEDEVWDAAIEVDGDIKGKDCLLRYKSGGRTLAVTSSYRDVESLKAELAMERGVQA